MRDFVIVFVHLIVTLARLARPGGLRSVVAESVLVRHQLLILNRGRQRAPNLRERVSAFREWNEVFPNASCIVTLLDRLVHHADVTAIEGNSYRVRESERETAARRNKK
jgi:hypothetical protein